MELSNLRLRVIDEMKHHPLRRMIDKGLMVTVNSDDPPISVAISIRITGEASNALTLDRKEIAELVRNSFCASLMTEVTRSAALAEVDRAVGTSRKVWVHWP